MNKEELESFITLLYEGNIDGIKEFVKNKQEILNDVTPMGTMLEIAEKVSEELFNKILDEIQLQMEKQED